MVNISYSNHGNTQISHPNMKADITVSSAIARSRQWNVCLSEVNKIAAIVSCYNEQIDDVLVSKVMYTYVSWKLLRCYLIFSLTRDMAHIPQYMVLLLGISYSKIYYIP